MPIFSALGAKCTVLDYSEKQLLREKEVARRENYEIKIVRADMTNPLPFEDESFNLIFHPSFFGLLQKLFFHINNLEGD